MNQLIDTHGKAIITGLLVVIAVLAIMLLGSCSTVTTRDSKVSDKDLAAFLEVLADPKKNVHAVLLVGPDGHDKSPTYGPDLREAKPCFWDPNLRLTAEKTPVLLPRECVKEGDEIDYPNQQHFFLTAGKRLGKGPIFFSADFEHRVICTTPLGGPC